MLKNETLRRDADAIIRASLNAVLPDEAVRRALKAFPAARAAGCCWWQRVRPHGRWHTRRWKRWAVWTAAWS